MHDPVPDGHQRGRVCERPVVDKLLESPTHCGLMVWCAATSDVVLVALEDGLPGGGFKNRGSQG
jgi:hypothetical protein